MHRLLSVLVGAAVLAGTSAEAARSDPTDIGREDGLVTTLVVGGSAVPISDVPWQAALLNANRFDRQDDANSDQFCGAAIISDEWLVTAAHCVDGATQSNEVEVVVGKSRLNEMTSADRMQISNIFVSPEWNPEDETGDIALLQLSQRLDLNGVTVKAISLPTSSETAYWPAVGASYTVSGWGCTVPVGIDESASSKCWESYSDNFYSNTLRSVEVVDVSGPSGDVPCGDIGPIPNIAEQIICAGVASGGQDSCSGDSGGPLVALLNDEVTLAGVVSSGFGCAQAGYPGFYTRVSAFRSWIDEVTGGIPSPTASGSFVALTPSRMMDTRSGDKVGELDGSGSVRELQVTGAGGVPASGVSAVALNVTAVSTETNDFGGFVTVFPCGTRPDASNLNFTSGQTIPNSVIAPVSSDGKVCFYVYGKSHLLADVSGYFVSGFEPLTPDRIMDTRSGSKVGELDGSGSVRELQVTGAGGVPLSGVSAVALNVTAVSTETNDFGGFVTVFPCGTRPDASNLNFTSGMTIPNSVIAPVSSDGKVCFYVYGKTHLLADVSGYFSSGFESLTPDRIMDTRSGDKVGELDGSGSAYELQVTGAGGVPASGVSAVALNVTAVSTETNDFGGFVTVFPCGTRPDASNLNFTTGMTIPNSVIAPVSDDGKVCFYVYGKAHLLADVSGYFGT